MSKNIVILSGSPRKGGNTDLLTDAFVKGAQSAGKTVTLFRVADMRIGGCLGCAYCHSHDGTCIQQDDMPQILDALKSAEAVVYASPIYYAGVTAQLKAAIDRGYALLRQYVPWKKGALLLTFGHAQESMADPTIAMYRAILGFKGLEDGGVIVSAGMHDKGEIQGHPALAQAEQLGRDI